MKILFEEMTSEQKAREKKEFAIRIGSRLKEVRKSKGLSQKQLNTPLLYILCGDFPKQWI
jgi:hypothetical protein